MTTFFEDDDAVIEDDGVPLPTLGRITMPAGAARLRASLTGSCVEKIRKAKAVKYSDAAETLLRTDESGRPKMKAPSNRSLAIMFANLIEGEATDVQLGKFANLLQKSWPEFQKKTIQAARDLAECEKAAARQSSNNGKRQKNVVNSDGFDELCAHGLKCLEQANRTTPEMFHHGSEMVRIPMSPTGDARFEILNQKSFNFVLNSQAAYLKLLGENTYVSVSAPKDVCEHLFCDPALPVPVLCGIVSVPTFTKSGRLVQKPGFDNESGLLYRPASGLEVPPIPAKPTKQEAEQARDILVKLFADFPFDGKGREQNLAAPGASMTNYIGLVLVPFLMPLIDGVVPATLLTKPAPGTGATLLAESAQLIVDGVTDLRPPLDRNEAERRKTLFSAIQMQKNYLVYDNVAGEMESPVMASFLTSQMWTDRVLGRTGERTVLNSSAMVWTGINPGFSRELRRRICLVRLDARTAEPSERDGFEIPDLKGHIEKHRGELIAACLTMIQYWIAEGQKKWTGKELSSFERWNWTVGGVLQAVGLDKFETNRKDLESVTALDDDPMQTLVEEWYTAATDPLSDIGLKAGASELLGLVQRAEIPFQAKLKRDAVDDYDFSPKSFGTILGAAKDRTFTVAAKEDKLDKKVQITLKCVGRDRSGVRWELAVVKKDTIQFADVAREHRRRRQRAA